MFAHYELIPILTLFSGFILFTIVIVTNLLQASLKNYLESLCN